MKKFDYTLDYKNLDLRKSPWLYTIGRGEQGVLTVEPYKSEILPFWRFKDPGVAKESANSIFGMFLEYLKNGDFIGADMSRKFLQMGYTRARRYANYKGGKKYKGPVPENKRGVSGSHGRELIERREEDTQKAESARIFKLKWEEAKSHPDYLRLRKEFLARYG